MKAAVVLDSWKLPIFERHLKAAGYAWTQHPGITADTITLSVEASDAIKLGAVVGAANGEAAATKAMRNRPVN